MFSVEVRDFDSWRNTARELLQRHVAPKDVSWRDSNQPALDFGDPYRHYLDLPIKTDKLTVSHDFFAKMKLASYYRSCERWTLMYRLTWRVTFEDKRLLTNTLDRDILILNRMCKAVSRDRHKMKAFVRFKSTSVSTNIENRNRPEVFPNAESEHFIAWFEPDHLILPLVAAFFTKRFSNMSWSILTPDLCMHWNQKKLLYSDGIMKPDCEDELEALWLQYYRHTFNPARLKIKAMQSEMPKKYWRNLPEAVLIDELIRSAQGRTQKMIDQDYIDPSSKLSSSQFVQEKQQSLRDKRTNSLDFNAISVLK